MKLKKSGFIGFLLISILPFAIVGACFIDDEGKILYRLTFIAFAILFSGILVVFGLDNIYTALKDLKFFRCTKEAIKNEGNVLVSSSFCDKIKHYPDAKTIITYLNIRAQTISHRIASSENSYLDTKELFKLQSLPKNKIVLL